MSIPSLILFIILCLTAGALSIYFLYNMPITRAARERRQKHHGMLRQLHWLAGLGEKEFKKVARRFRIRSFRSGAKILVENDPDNGLFLIVEGSVRVEIRGELMGKAGVGKVMGEMAFLSGHPRTATVIAETQVMVLWIGRVQLKSVMKKYPQLENGLWEFASMRYAMNLLGKKEPYSLWEQNRFIQWLSAGEIRLPNENGWMDLEGKIGVLVIGTAAQHDGSVVVKAPCTLSGTDYIFSKEARVFLRDS